ncbi:MAG: flagellar basal body L-ring protein FlgH [Azoarcus sp.]|jgi:flagellar L-ring protein precursor FlgH|nr:flagellar basal body L-ring protein FlgH [Azoarcus sp.]
MNTIYSGTKFHTEYSHPTFPRISKPQNVSRRSREPYFITLAFVLLILLTLLTACAPVQPTPPTSVHQPMTARPAEPSRMRVSNGAIFQPGVGRSLLEDRRARRVGDIITISLVEKTSAQKSANASTGRKSSLTGGLSASSSKLPLSSLAGVTAEASSDSSFEGKGAAAANNAFTGTITVTVIDVLGNGNMLVSGEKMVTINQGNEYIRFSGIVNADNVSSTNTVQSTQVADARIEYRGSGFVDEANSQGWLHRFFNFINPF